MVVSVNVTILAPRRIRALTNDVSIVVNGAKSDDVIELYYEDDVTPLIGQIVTEVKHEVCVICTLIQK